MFWKFDFVIITGVSRGESNLCLFAMVSVAFIQRGRKSNTIGRPARGWYGSGRRWKEKKIAKKYQISVRGDFKYALRTRLALTVIVFRPYVLYYTGGKKYEIIFYIITDGICGIIQREDFSPVFFFFFLYLLMRIIHNYYSRGVGGKGQ